MRYVEAGCAYYLKMSAELAKEAIGSKRQLTNITFVKLSIGGVDTILTHRSDGTVSEVAVRLEERLEIPWSRRYSPASKLPLRNQHLTKRRVVIKLFCHLLSRQPDTLFVVLALHKDVKRLVGARNDTFSMLKMVLWIPELLLF